MNYYRLISKGHKSLFVYAEELKDKKIKMAKSIDGLKWNAVEEDNYNELEVWNPLYDRDLALEELKALTKKLLAMRQ